MRPRAWMMTFLLLAVLAAGCQAQKAEQAQQRQQALQTKTYMVPMRDGVKLATTVALPEGDGPWPAVLTRTPYGRMRFMKDAPAMVRNGYARVAQDLRGRFESEGTDTVFLSDGWGEQQDGYDTIQWIAEQPWCDGNVGMIGGSAMGITQYLAAGSVPPALKACHATVATASMYHYAAYQGGAFRKALVENWMRGQKFSDEAFEKVVGHPVYDDLWAATDLVARAPQVTVPMVHIGGWYDVFAQGTLDAFDALQHRGGEGAKGNQILMFGPWVHGTRPGGNLKFPLNALRKPVGRLMVDWFGNLLSGRKPESLSKPPVHYYVMGACEEPGAPGNEWRNVADWPVPAKQTALYLHESGEASFSAPDSADASKRFEYDPADPVPTVGGCNLTIPSGPADQQVVERRDDVLVFTTAPLEEPLEVTGQIFAKLWVSSDCPDTDFTAKLTDVYPDGRSMLICDGILRMRFRNSFEAEEMMEPGEVYEAQVDLWSTSIIFNKGHRIRVAISSSNAPRFDPNPNTGAGFRENDDTRIATNTVYLSKKRPSQVLLSLPE